MRSFPRSINSSRTCTRFTKPMIESIAADLQRAPFRALQTGRRLRDPRRLHRRKTEQSLGRLLPIRLRHKAARPTVLFIASATASSTRLTTNSCVARMLRAVSFGCAVVAIAGTKTDDRRIAAERIEKTERRGVQLPVAAKRSHPRDRSRRDERSQHRVSAVGVFSFEIEFHGYASANHRMRRWRASDCGCVSRSLTTLDGGKNIRDDFVARSWRRDCLCRGRGR